MQSNAGFIGLQGPLGALLILFSALLLGLMIYVGARLVRIKEAADRERRAELRRQVEAKNE